MISNRYEKCYIQFQNGTEGAGKFCGYFYTAYDLFFIRLVVYFWASRPPDY